MIYDGKVRTIIGLFALFFFGFLLISYLTYSPGFDPPSSTHKGIKNYGGQVGAYLAHYLHRSLGPVSWLVIAWLALASVGLFSSKTGFWEGLNLVGWVMIVVGVSGLLAWLRPDASYFIPSYLASRTKPLMGPAGSLLLFTFLSVTGIFLKPLAVLIREVRHAGHIIAEAVSVIGWLLEATAGYFLRMRSRLFDFWRFLGSFFGGAVSEEVDPRKQSPSTENKNPTRRESDEESHSARDSDTVDSKSADRESSDASRVIPFDKDRSKEKEGEGDEQNSSKTQSPDDTEKSNASGPVEVSRERPEVDDADMTKYELPRLRLLRKGSIGKTIPDEESLNQTATNLEETFKDFGLEGDVVDVDPGPVLTMYEVEPGPGVSVKKFRSRADDIKLNLAVESIRIVSPIPGKSALGIEVPNPDRALVRLRDVLESEEFSTNDRSLPIGLGLDVLGDPMVIDLANLPHLLVAGATGSGKSVCINSLICSLLFKLPPDEMKFIMIDPKRVELNLYDGLPHLMTPVIDDTSEATKVLKWAVREMENRYEKLSDAGMRDIASYNDQVAGDNEKIPYVVLVVDELSDLMLTNPKECEKAITRLAQMARAVGIHMVLATQRPSTDVITGLIKANLPARLAFRVSSGTDSRVILDENGAETLLGNGDLLYLSSGEPHPKRGQGSFLTGKETRRIIRFTKEQVKPSYVQKDELFERSTGGKLDESMDDEYYEDAKKLVIERQKASASMLQRRFRVGYNRAARMIDAMEEEGIVGPHRGSKARNVLVDAEEFFNESEANEPSS